MNATMDDKIRRYEEQLAKATTSAEDAESLRTKIYRRKYYLQNKKKLNAYTKAYYAQHKDRMRSQMKEWDKRNPKKRCEISKRWCKNNPEKARSQGRRCSKRYYARHKKEILKKMLKYQNERYKADPTYRIMKVMRARHRAALKGKLKLQSTKALLGCSSSEWRSHIESMWYNCPITGAPMTWENYGRGPGTWQIDHRVPMCTFDLERLEEQQRANHYTNTQPLWYKDHCAKGTSVPKTHKWNGTSWAVDI